MLLLSPHTLPLHTHTLHAPPLTTHPPSAHPYQFLLGGFYWIEAVALFEDILGGVTALNNTYAGGIKIDHYDPADITSAYQNAAK